MGSLGEKEVLIIRLDFIRLNAAIKTFRLRLLRKSDGMPLRIQPAPFGTDIVGRFGRSYKLCWTVPAAGSYLLEVLSTVVRPG